MVRKVFLKETDYKEIIDCIVAIQKRYGSTKLITALEKGYKNNYLSMDSEYFAACSMLLGITERGSRIKKVLHTKLQHSAL